MSYFLHTPNTLLLSTEIVAFEVTVHYSSDLLNILEQEASFCGSHRDWYLIH